MNYKDVITCDDAVNWRKFTSVAQVSNWQQFGRDRPSRVDAAERCRAVSGKRPRGGASDRADQEADESAAFACCLLYTSDAADE